MIYGRDNVTPAEKRKYIAYARGGCKERGKSERKEAKLEKQPLPRMIHTGTNAFLLQGHERFLPPRGIADLPINTRVRSPFGKAKREESPMALQATDLQSLLGGCREKNCFFVFFFFFVFLFCFCFVFVFF